ncbi:MAG: hypothetical protein R3313_01260 [Candidatus Saccharimonadales bacterium]|nr:hypothetical protein [Candidatus Saccharimonadales bacterium]
MLTNNQRGSIIGLALTVIFIFIFVSMIMKASSDDNGQDSNNTDQSIIDRSQDTVNNANEAGQKANSILKGLTGN